MSPALKPYGERAILAYDLSDDERHGLLQALAKGLPLGCVEYVGGHETVLFLYRDKPLEKELTEYLKSVPEAQPTDGENPIHDVPVIYDGPDLDAVAAETGLSREAVIEIHSASIYSVRMMGFSPGFPYLDGLDPRLHLPRKSSPRERIEPGSVAIGGPHAGIYSVSSPGGWHLLGRTELVLFNPPAAKQSAPEPRDIFHFAPGDRLRFQPVVK